MKQKTMKNSGVINTDVECGASAAPGCGWVCHYVKTALAGE